MVSSQKLSFSVFSLSGGGILLPSCRTCSLSRCKRAASSFCRSISTRDIRYCLPCAQYGLSSQARSMYTSYKHIQRPMLQSSHCSVQYYWNPFCTASLHTSSTVTQRNTQEESLGEQNTREEELKKRDAEQPKPTEPAPEERSIGTRLLVLVGRMFGYYSRKAVLARSANKLYENCADSLNYEEFFEVCNLPDSFQSWFLVTHLHVWMLLVRLKREGDDGAYLIRELTASFWHDVDSRMRAIGVHNVRVASQSMRELLYQFYGLTLAYEEGLLSSDKVLASAVWRNMVFDKQKNTDPVQLAKMVQYIRKQVKHMDQLDSSEIKTGSLSLLGLNEAYREEWTEEAEGGAGGPGEREDKG